MQKILPVTKKLLNSISNDLNLLNLSKHISSTTFSSVQNAVKPKSKHDWNIAVKEAEKIVGHPTSFSGLRWLLSDETANVAVHFRKLIGSNHPLLKTAENLMYDDRSNMQDWGLIVLLISKAAGHASHITDLKKDKSSDVLHSQRTLAEVTELLRTSTLIHQDMVNLQTLPGFGNEQAEDSELITGNKMVLLIGDYLLAYALKQLANMRNQELIELIFSAERNLIESNFIGDRDDENVALPTDPSLKVNLTDEKPLDDIDNTCDIDMKLILGHAEREWDFRHTLSCGTLLSNSCQGTLKLAGHSDDLQKHGYTFGKHLALTYQASMDLEPFKLQELPLNTTFSLVSAPVLYHLEYDPSIYEEIRRGKESVTNIDFRKLHNIIVSGLGIEKTKELQRKHGQRAIDVLNEFPNCDARTALQNIILAMISF